MIHHHPAVSRRALLASAAAAPAAAVLAGCGDDTPPPDAPGEPDQVTYLTSFGALGRDSYVWVADALGYFAEENITVEIVPGAGSTPNIQALQEGNAHFAVGDFASAVKSWSDGDQGFRCIAFIQQRSLVALLSTDPDVRVPADLEGRTVALAKNTVTDYLFEPWASGSGLEPDSVEVQYVDPGQLIPNMAEGRVAAIENFVVGKAPLQAQAGGTEPVVFPYDEALPGLVGITLMTTPRMLDERRDLCIRFQSALLRGLRHALDNPAEAGDILNDAEPDTPAEIAAAEMTLMQPYARPYGPLGAARHPDIAGSIGVLKSVGVIDMPYPEVEDLVELDLLPQQQ